MTFPGPARYMAGTSAKLPKTVNTVLLPPSMAAPHKATAVRKGMVVRRPMMIHKDIGVATTSQSLVVMASLNPAVMASLNLAAMVTPATTMALQGTTAVSDMLWEYMTWKS